MITGVGRCGIFLTPFNSPTPKTPVPSGARISQRYLQYKPSYCLFCLKFRCHGNRGRHWYSHDAHEMSAECKSGVDDRQRDTSSFVIA